jgi:hypothetical protein
VARLFSFRPIASRSPAPPSLPRPEHPERFAVPGDNGLGLDDHKGRTPVCPDAGKLNPQRRSTGASGDPSSRSVAECGAVPECNILQLQCRRVFRTDDAPMTRIASDPDIRVSSCGSGATSMMFSRSGEYDRAFPAAAASQLTRSREEEVQVDRGVVSADADSERVSVMRARIAAKFVSERLRAGPRFAPEAGRSRSCSSSSRGVLRPPAAASPSRRLPGRNRGQAGRRPMRHHEASA